MHTLWFEWIVSESIHWDLSEWIVFILLRFEWMSCIHTQRFEWIDCMHTHEIWINKLYSFTDIWLNGLNPWSAYDMHSEINKQMVFTHCKLL